MNSSMVRTTRKFYTPKLGLITWFRFIYGSVITYLEKQLLPLPLKNMKTITPFMTTIMSK